MSNSSNLCFDVMMTVVVFIAGGALPWLIYRVYQGMLNTLGEGAGSEAARKALHSMTGNAMVALSTGVVLGGSITSIASSSIASANLSKWMAAAALTWVMVCILFVFVKLRRSPEPLKSL